MSDRGRSSAPTSPLRVARRIAVAVIGTTVLAVGLALVVLPGPAMVVIPMGLAILATEFVWARRLLCRVKAGATRVIGGRPRMQRDSPTSVGGHFQRPRQAARIAARFL
jgi:hypothetical protein